jgi:2-succinyl-6-hydroxy-2,4-cyclohexadiene-1-carboxylate synthase
VPAALLLHGFTGSASAWGEARERLREAGVEATAVDLPGHGARAGEVDPRRFTLEGVSAEVGDALTRIAGDAAPPLLVGYSMGGRLALHCALAFPDRVGGLVLESASPGLATAAERAERREADEALARRLESAGIRPFVDAWEVLPLFASQRRLDTAVRRRVRRGRLSNDPRSLAASLRGLGTGALPSLWDRLGQVSVPTLVLVGADDAKFVAIGRRMARALPAGTLRELPGAGHAVHLERPGAWVEAVMDFVRMAGVSG